ncbi:hypothetical protein, partial [Planomonospora algeriensis]
AGTAAAVGAAAVVRGPVAVRDPAPAAVAAVTGFSVAVPYLLLVDYGAPRFLLPAYALLVVPAAEALRWAAGRRRPRVAAALVAAVLLAHTAVQGSVLAGQAHAQNEYRSYLAGVVEDMTRLGVRPPCTLVDDLVDPAMMFVSRCDHLNLSDPRNSLGARIAAAEPGRVFALLTRDPPPAAMEGWERHVLREKDGEPFWTAHLLRKDAPADTSGRTP